MTHDIYQLIELARQALKAISRHPEFIKVRDDYSPDMHIGDGLLALDQLEDAIANITEQEIKK